jgi:hypothetical protein
MTFMCLTARYTPQKIARRPHDPARLLEHALRRGAARVLGELDVEMEVKGEAR